MMNNYNPYTVPENFFETQVKKALDGYKCRRRIFLYSAAAAIVAVAVICVPMFVNSSGSQARQTEMRANNLASMYEYDIFLQVNFTK